MKSPDVMKPIVLERFIYRQGQTILARDFRDEQYVSDQDRWWHNRAVHNAYGIVWPLQPAQEGQSKQSLLLCPFLGYDSFGREIILPCAQAIPFPKLTSESPKTWLVLAARGPDRYRDDGRGPSAIPLCFPELALPPKLWWVPESSWSFRAGIPVAQITKNCKSGGYCLNRDYVPPGTRPLTSPRIVSGSTLPGDTAWHRDKLQSSLPDCLRSSSIFTVKIDTSACGFNQVPCYQARLVGRPIGNARLSQASSTAGSADPHDESEELFVLGGWISCERAQGLNYSILVRCPVDDPQRQLDLFSKFARAAKLGVFWLGVEADSSQTPGAFWPGNVATSATDVLTTPKSAGEG